jgi:peptide-methionine (S)-S-oxide reductase
VEAVFRRLAGVLDVTAGYAGGRSEAPTYEQVCAGGTGHIEVVQVRFDPTRVPYTRLLEVFFATHDPTTLDQQGNDVGVQYRSIVFVHDAAQRAAVEAAMARIEASDLFDRPLVTEVRDAPRFWPAEAHHQDFWARNPRQAYCSATIPPKLRKLEKLFGEHLA